MTFATLGGSLKIFNLENGYASEGLSYSCVNGSESDAGRNISWSGDGQWIVGPIENGGALPVFKYEKSNKLTRMRCIKDADASTAVFLNCTNRLLAVGAKSGAVKLWNIKDKRLHQTVCQSDVEPVKFLQVSEDDMYVAAAGSFSQIKIYGLTTNKLTNTLEAKYPAELSDLKFSSIKKNYLACSTLEGSVIVWDVYKSTTILDRRNAHIGACTGIAFSPINHFIIASVAMSDCFIIHDMRQKPPSVQVQIGAPASCVELVKNEPYALIGSRDGRLLLYDLRALKTTYDQIINDKPITCVRGVHNYSGKAYEDVAVGTPENDCPKQTCEMSIADIITPPSTATVTSQIPSMNLLDMISPITHAGIQHRATIDKTTSTPNQPQFLDSFAKLLESPAASPVVNYVSGQSPFHHRPSPLAVPNSTAAIHRPEGLNGIREVSENEKSSPPANFSGIIRDELASMKEELLEHFSVVVRNEVNALQQQLLEFEQRMLANIERNRFAIFKAIRETEDLRNVIRLEQVVTEIIEKQQNEI